MKKTPAKQAKSTTPPAAGTPSKPGTTTTPAANRTTTPPAATKTIAPRTVVKTVIRTKTVVRTVTAPSAPPPKPKTVIRYQTKTVNPDVPVGAFLPSRHPALALTTFVVTGSNVGCKFASSSARCDIVQRVWAPPAQPSRCKTTWGNALLLKGTPRPLCVRRHNSDLSQRQGGAGRLG